MQFQCLAKDSMEDIKIIHKLKKAYMETGK